MINLKKKEELPIFVEGGKRLALILETISKKVLPGVTAGELNDIAMKMTKDGGDLPAFMGYTPYGAKRPYPSALCVSVNDEIVHGISNEHEKIINDGDIVSIDMGIIHKDLFLDSAVTVIAGKGDLVAKNLVKGTSEALEAGIKAIRVGGHIGDIGFAVSAVARKYGYALAQQLAGHGVGYAVHEDPYVPNEGNEGEGEEIVSGLVIAIEPMLCEKKGAIKLDKDGYTYRTKDGGRSAHAEHTVFITEDGPVVVTRK